MNARVNSAPGCPVRTQAPKYRQVADTLRQQILSGSLPVGAKLPSMEEISRQFNLSLPTAFRGVQELAREGLVSSNANPKGTVVIRQRPVGAISLRTVACLLRPAKPRNEDDNFALEMLESIQKEISEQGYRYIHHGLSETNYVERMLELAQEQAVAGFLIDQKTPAGAIRRLAQSGLPAVLFNRHLAAPNLTCVTANYDAIGREAVRLMVERRYPRVGFYWVSAHEAGWDERLEAVAYTMLAPRKGFIEAARAIGYAEDDVVMIPECAGPESVDDPASYGLPLRKSAGWRPIGVFTTTDRMAGHILAAIRKTDLRLGEDVGVAGCFDLPVGQRHSPPPSTFRIDPHEIGREAVRALLRRIEDSSDGADTVFTPAPFIDRGTL